MRSVINDIIDAKKNTIYFPDNASVTITYSDGIYDRFEDIIRLTYNDNILIVVSKNGWIKYYRLKHLKSWELNYGEANDQ